MFGKFISIQEEFPNYMLDYQERPEAKTETRWIDRITIDGKWSGNLFDFYNKIIKKLTADLKVPFKLEGDKRVDQTQVHDALREALVNTLVHADYSGKASILVVKRPDMFGFRNPGLMRITVEQAINGYEHDCRNEKLHQMFHSIGLGERAGSGIPNIFIWWNELHWSPPYLYEKLEPYEQTLFELRMIDLIDKDIIAELNMLFGEKFQSLDNTGRLIMAVALIEQTVAHARLKEICSEHTYDLSRTLHKLVQDGMLTSNGYGQGTIYHLPNKKLVTPDDVFGSRKVAHINPENSSGGFSYDGLKYVLYDDIESIDPEIMAELKEIIKPIYFKTRLPKNTMRTIVKNLCQNKYLTLALLVKLLGRSEDYVRKDILNPMVENQELLRAFPKTPNDPRQAYTSTS